MDAPKKYKLSFEADTDKQGHVVNDAFLKMIDGAKRGGDDLETNFFSKQQLISQYFDFLAENGAKAYNDGTDPNDSDRPIVIIISSGVESEWSVAPAAKRDGSSVSVTGDGPGRVGTAYLRTGFTQDSTVRFITLGISVAELPAGWIAGSNFYSAIAKPVYSNLKTMYEGWASRRAGDLAGPDPIEDSDLDELADHAANEVDDSIKVAGQAVEEGIEEAEVAIEWLRGGVAFGAMAVLAVIPVILQAIAHTMYSQLAVINLTGDELNVKLEHMAHGGTDIVPANGKIPAMHVDTDVSGGTTNAKVAYEANYHFMNKSGYAALGYVVSVNADSAEPIGCVIDIPWKGTNSLWAGSVPASPPPNWSSLYGSAPKREVITQFSIVGPYKVTLSTNKLKGTTDNVYRYDNLLVIEPAP